MDIYDIKLEKRNGELFKLSNLKGKVLLIVNTATGCGFTPQYEGLEKLYKKYNSKGLEIIDLPCDQFGHQAPGTDDEIHEFCTSRYNTSFDQFKKIEVNGDNENSLFTYLKSYNLKEIINGIGHKTAMAGVKKISKTCKNKNDIVWNFTKFLVDRDGNVVYRYSPIEDPLTMDDKIKKLLG